MSETRHLDTPEQLVHSPIRCASRYSRRLMTQASTISQLAAPLGKHPAWVRHHVLQLLKADLIELVEERKVGGYTEKYYRATANSFAVATMVCPIPASAVSWWSSATIRGAPACRAPAPRARRPLLFTLATGSLEGLMPCARVSATRPAATSSTPRPASTTCPTPAALPGWHAGARELADREQGLLVAPGNPDRLRSLETSPARTALRQPQRRLRHPIWLDRRADRVRPRARRSPGTTASFDARRGRASSQAAGPTPVSASAPPPARMVSTPSAVQNVRLVVPWERTRPMPCRRPAQPTRATTGRRSMPRRLWDPPHGDELVVAA